MIWYATTKDLMTKYIKRSETELMETDYVILSSRIRTTNSRVNVTNFSDVFLRSGGLKGVGAMTDPDSFLNRENFKSTLLTDTRMMSILCAVLECAILDKHDTLFLCSPQELKTYNYMCIITDVIFEIFHYPICRYPETKEFDLEDVIRRLVYYNDQVKKLIIGQASPMDKQKILKKLKRKELQAALEERHAYTDNMTKAEMIELLIHIW